MTPDETSRVLSFAARAHAGTPPPYWTEARIIGYRDEARSILDQLGWAEATLARRLQAKIESS